MMGKSAPAMTLEWVLKKDFIETEISSLILDQDVGHWGTMLRVILFSRI